MGQQGDALEEPIRLTEDDNTLIPEVVKTKYSNLNRLTCANMRYRAATGTSDIKTKARCLVDAYEAFVSALADEANIDLSDKYSMQACSVLHIKPEEAVCVLPVLRTLKTEDAHIDTEGLDTVYNALGHWMEAVKLSLV